MANHNRFADRVYARDNHTCRACGYYSEYRFMLTLDHIKPQAEGGKDSLKNLQCLCQTCNNIKSNKPAPALKIRQKPNLDMTLRKYESMLLANRKEFYSSIYGKASKGWFLRQEKTLALIDNGWTRHDQFQKLWDAIRRTFNSPRASREWAISKLAEYRQRVEQSTPANMQCVLAYK